MTNTFDQNLDSHKRQIRVKLPKPRFKLCGLQGHFPLSRFGPQKCGFQSLIKLSSHSYLN